MEVASYTQEVSEHAASLLANLNLLRYRALFCDCVVREGGNSVHLYPAHRCVLAASSPVFAALLSSSGALLELHDPRLPAAVLVHVLDYIYTGVVPSLGRQQLFYHLLCAAEYLQMDGLLEALRTGQTDDGGFHTKTGYGFYSDSKFGETPVKPLEPHHGIHTSNKISCIKNTEVNTAGAGDVNLNAKSDINPRSEQTVCTMNVISSYVINTEEQKQPQRSQEREQSHRYQINSTREQRRSQRTREKNLTPRVNNRKHLCSSLTYKRREKLQRNKMEEDTNISTASQMASVSKSSSAPPDPNPVPLYDKNPPPLPHRSQPVIQHSSEALPQASLLVGYTTHASSTPCGHPRSTAEEEKTPRSNDTDYTDDGSPAADTKQDGQSWDWRSNNPPEVQDQNILDYVRDQCDVYEACLKGSMVSNRLFRGDCEDIHGFGPQGTKNNDVECGQDPVADCKDCFVHWGISLSEKQSDHHSDHRKERKEQLYESELPSGAEKATHTQDVDTVASAFGLRVILRGAVGSLPVTGLSPGSENDHGNLFPRPVPRDEESHANQDGFYSLQSTFDFVKGNLSTSNHPEEGSLSFSDQSDKEKEHPGSHPLQEFDIGSNPQNTSASSVPTSNHTYNNTNEQSYLGHLRYHYLPSDQPPSHLVEKHSNQKARNRPSSDPNQSPEREQFDGGEPGAKLLLLGINSRSVQLQMFYKNRVRENGGGYGAAGGESREGWVEAGPQAVVEELCTGVRVSPGVGLNLHAEERHAINKQDDVDVCNDGTRTQAGQITRDVAGTHSKMEDRDYDLVTALTTSAAASMPLNSLSLCTPAWLLAGRSSPESQQLYQCSLCERSFSQRGSLNRHVRSHLGVRPYLCPHCPMTFSRQYRVTEHMRVHERCVLREDHLKTT